MQFKILAATLLMLAPAPALADVTATYAVRDKVVTVEIDDAGNTRAQFGSTVALIRRDGVDYLIIYAPDGRAVVMRVDAVIAYVTTHSPPPPLTPVPPNWTITRSTPGDAVVAGHSGSVWNLGPKGDGSLDIVMSSDPELAPVGQLFEHAAVILTAAMDPQAKVSGEFLTIVRSLLSHGTPIRIRDATRGTDVLTLQSVSGAKIDPHRLELPGPVLDAATVLAKMPPPPVP